MEQAVCLISVVKLKEEDDQVIRAINRKWITAGCISTAQNEPPVWHYYFPADNQSDGIPWLLSSADESKGVFTRGGMNGTEPSSQKKLPWNFVHLLIFRLFYYFQIVYANVAVITF